MNVLVIGGSGFTGRRLLASCPSTWTVHALARSEQATTTVACAGALPVEADLDRPESVAAAVRAVEPEVVICLASLGFGHGPALVSALQETGAPYTVFTSTTGIFTRLNPSSKTLRVEAEARITDSSLPWLIVRPTMIYGRPGDRNMERLLGWLRVVPFVAAPDGGRAEQQPVHVDDLVASIIRAVERRVSRVAIDLPGPEPVPFHDVVRFAGDAIGRKARTIGVPLRPLAATVRLQERLLHRPRIREEQVHRLVEHKRFDPGPAAELVDHRPRPLQEGLLSEADLLFDRLR